MWKKDKNQNISNVDKLVLQNIGEMVTKKNTRSREGEAKTKKKTQKKK